jgi:hypothetical protein
VKLGIVELVPRLVEADTDDTEFLPLMRDEAGEILLMIFLAVAVERSTSPRRHASDR